MKKISIIIPVYYNGSNLNKTIPRLLALVDANPKYEMEFVFVDDGSGDNSLEILLTFRAKHPECIKVLKLTRNFGSMAAIQAGFTAATGDCVGMISADLQDPPELFVEMLEFWENGNKAIFAIREDRDESFFQKYFSNGYYYLIRKFAISNYPKGGFDFFLIDRQIVDEINKIKEKNTNLMTLIFWLGFKPIMIPYIRRKREDGISRWTFTKKIKLFVDTFVAFSYFPIRLFSFLGILISISSFLYGIFLFLYWYFNGIDVKGYVTTILILTFTSGVQMAMLGVLGEYLWRTLDEVRRRPPFVIDEVFDEAETYSEETN